MSNWTAQYKRSCVTACSLCSAAINLHGDGAHSNFHPASALFLHGRPSLSHCKTRSLSMKSPIVTCIFDFSWSITLSECESCLWSQCARSHAPPPQRSWRRSPAQSTSAGVENGRRGDNKAANSEAEEVDIRRGTQMCEAHWREATRWKRRRRQGRAGK